MDEVQCDSSLLGGDLRGLSECHSSLSLVPVPCSAKAGSTGIRTPLAGSIGMQPATTATPNDNARWINPDTVPQSSGTITGLPSDTRRYLRLRGIFPSGPGPWSDIAGKMVP
jgi:hypothetical protein